MLVVNCSCFHYYGSPRVPATEWFPGEVHSYPRQDWEPYHDHLVTGSQLLGMFFLLLETVNNHELENVIVIAFNSDIYYAASVACYLVY